MVGIPVGWASVVAMFVPLLSGVALKYRGDSSRVHALFAIALTAAVAVVGMFTDAAPQHTVQEIVSAFLGSFLPMLGAYLGFWKPVVDVNKILPGTGV